MARHQMHRGLRWRPARPLFLASAMTPHDFRHAGVKQARPINLSPEAADDWLKDDGLRHTGALRAATRRR